ncbi:11859_t:CDS:2 [Ambispora leptoticha]|uniref:11859_t:CDS:1 n=1 Tax=Ambispora leptoticha TaxID=144679 RepID=A0A9N9BNB9_9GLOM|nr:11859_t:CDS:2 [Ambispora leptoticha]
MSTSTGKTISIPTINEVEGYKTTEALIKFLDDQNIGLDDDDLQILQKQKLVGEVKRKKRIVSSINNQAVDAKKFQYYQRYNNEHSKASDKEMRDFMDFTSRHVKEHPEVSYEDVVKEFKSQGKQTT